MKYDDIIRIPYTTLPNFEKYRGPLFRDTPSPAHRAAKNAMFKDDVIYGRSWFETKRSTDNELPQKAAKRLALEERSNAELGRKLSSIKDLALLLQEDVAILHKGRLEACCFMFPSGWAPETKIGMNFAELHLPVADGERLRASADHIAQLMCGEHCYHRSVWGLSASKNLSAHPRYIDRIPAPQTVADIWFRYEHQITVPIEPGLSSLFLVDVQLVPFGDLDEGTRARIEKSIASMSEAVAAYKAMAPFKRVLGLN